MAHTERVAIVTGASRGSGRATASRLAVSGFAVVVNCAGSIVDAEGVVRAIRAAGGRTQAVQADVSSAGDMRRLFDEAEQAFSGVDVLVDNAGVMTPGPLAEAGDEQFERDFAVNVRCTFNGLREAARQLRANGRIVDFFSTTPALNALGHGICNATKGAVEGFTRVLAKKPGARGVTVNAVAPGPVGTELFLNGKSEAEVGRMTGMAPLGRIGDPREIAEVVAFLASQEAVWVNGQVVRVNGGIG
jgi:3-oxoacyl-[acyl-carrier protein] reductase